MIKIAMRTLVMAVVATALTPVPAHAGKLSISPLLATLSESKRVESLALKNDSEKLVVVQVKLLSWKQDEDGKDSLMPSEALSYMPRVLQLKPGEERSVRIGYGAKAPPATELAYRIYLTEQPGATTDPQEKGQLRVALRMGVPVFVSPKAAERDQGTLGEVTAAKRAASFVVKNTGNARLVMKTVVVTGRDASGATVFTVDMGRQFVLAGLRKRFSARLPAETCGKATSIDIVGELQTTGTLTATLPLPGGACRE